MCLCWLLCMCNLCASQPWSHTLKLCYTHMRMCMCIWIHLCMCLCMIVYECACVCNVFEYTCMFMCMCIAIVFCIACAYTCMIVHVRVFCICVLSVCMRCVYAHTLTHACVCNVLVYKHVHACFRMFMCMCIHFLGWLVYVQPCVYTLYVFVYCCCVSMFKLCAR